MKDNWYTIHQGSGSVVATAIHNGHDVRPDMAGLFSISDSLRFHEEDPYTAAWTGIAPIRIVNEKSRFELDLNRERNKAVYLKPEDAWGLDIWKAPPPEEVIDRSLALYDEFYKTCSELFNGFRDRGEYFVVLDLHTYNHLREGQHGTPADPPGNPEINVGTGSISGALWRPVVNRFIEDMKRFDFLGRRLDVRENVKFRGGFFSQWVNGHFSETGCAIAVEVKKIFMNEWTGEIYRSEYEAVKQALGSTIPGLEEEIRKLGIK